MHDDLYFIREDNATTLCADPVGSGNVVIDQQQKTDCDH